MCDVCVAGEALRAGNDGYASARSPDELAYGDPDLSGAATVYLRARGEDPEGPALYQLRRGDEPWPAAWSEAEDLAVVAMAYGLDVKWRAVAPAVRAWVCGRGPLPSVREALVSRDRGRAARFGPR